MNDQIRATERRRYDRAPADLDVKLHRGELPSEGLVREISEGGALIESDPDCQAEPGDRITVWIRLEGRTERDSVIAEVAYRREGHVRSDGRIGVALGVRFENLEPETAAALTRMVERERAAGRLIYDSQGRRAVDAAWGLSSFLRAVVDSENVLVVVFDERGDLILWNRAAEEATGYGQADLGDLEGCFRRLIEDDHQLSHLLEVAEAVSTSGEPVDDVETSVRTESGTQRVVSWSLRRFVEHDTVIGLILVGRDITEQREIEQQLRQAQKLEAVGSLAGGIAHDFNNILMAIIGYSEMIKTRVEADDPILRFLDGILSCTARGSSLTRQLLAFSRRQVLNPVAMSVNDLVGETEDMLRRLIGEQHTLRSVLCEDLWSTMADPVQIQQVLVNLVVNARDASGDGGLITIETANVVIDEDRAGGHDVMAAGQHVMLSVSDRGSGIDRVTLARIFEPFFTTKAAGVGTGLGLSTVYGIVKQSGGFVWVYSEPDLGTVFKVFLPRHAAADESTDGALREQASVGGDETVLLVEDDPVVRMVVQQMLMDAGYTVLEAAEAQAALDRAAGESFDLLLSDIVMPGMSGVELARVIRGRHPAVAILLMSGYSETVAGAGEVFATEEAFLAKPVNRSVLLRTVRSLLDDAAARRAVGESE